MSRPLLALCLCLFAASAFAGEPGVNDDDAVAKPGKATAVSPTTPDGDAPVTHPAAAAPARAIAAHPSRRWHSLLPGMIR